MTTQDLITIPEASKLTGKAPITIRRTILKHRKEVLAKKIGGKWCADRKAILKHYDINPGADQQQKAQGDISAPGVPVNIIEVLKDQLSLNKDQLAVKDKQIEAKDKQIEDMGERLRELNIMLHKNQLALIGEMDTVETETKQKEDVKEKKDKKKMKFAPVDYMIIIVVTILLYLSWLMTFG